MHTKLSGYSRTVFFISFEVILILPVFYEEDAADLLGFDSGSAVYFFHIPGGSVHIVIRSMQACLS